MVLVTPLQWRDTRWRSAPSEVLSRRETPRVKTYYAVHLWYREHPADVVYDPITIRHLNTTAAEVLRLVYYEDSRLLPPISDTSTVDNTTGP